MPENQSTRDTSGPRNREGANRPPSYSEIALDAEILAVELVIPSSVGYKAFPPSPLGEGKKWRAATPRYRADWMRECLPAGLWRWFFFCPSWDLRWMLVSGLVSFFLLQVWWFAFSGYLEVWNGDGLFRVVKGIWLPILEFHFMPLQLWKISYSWKCGGICEISAVNNE